MDVKDIIVRTSTEKKLIFFLNEIAEIIKASKCANVTALPEVKNPFMIIQFVLNGKKKILYT